MSREFHKLLGPMARRIRLASSRGVVSGVTDSAKMQRLQVKLLADEVRDLVERFQQYGFTSVPHRGAEAVFLSLNGSRDQGVVICVDDRRYRLTGLADGEVALYDDLGQHVHLKRTGIDLESPFTVRIAGKEVHVHAEERLRFDCGGYGEDWVFASGTYRVDTWKIGPVVAGTANNIAPPEHG